MWRIFIIWFIRYKDVFCFVVDIEFFYIVGIDKIVIYYFINFFIFICCIYFVNNVFIGSRFFGRECIGFLYKFWVVFIDVSDMYCDFYSIFYIYVIWIFGYDNY